MNQTLINLTPIVNGITGSISILIGIYVLSQQYRKIEAWAFFTFSLGTGLWIGGLGILLATHTLWVVPVINVGGLLLVVRLTWFVLTFPQPLQKRVPICLILAPLILCGIYLLLSGELIRQVEFTELGEMVVTHGAYMGIWAVLLFLYVLLSLGILTYRFYTASPYERSHLYYLFAGIGTFVICAVVFDAILPGLFGITRLNYLGPLGSLFFLTTTAYALIRHDFLDSKVVIQRSLIYSTLFFIFVILYCFLLITGEKLLEHAAPLAFPVSTLSTILVAIYTAPQLERSFRRITDPFFFKAHYSSEVALAELTQMLQNHTTSTSLICAVIAFLGRTLRPNYIYFLESGTNKCFVHHSCECIPLSTRNHSSEVIVPIYSKGKDVGEFILGGKRSGEPYTSIDRSLLQTVSANISIAYEKAELYQKLEEYTDDLDKRVAERTQYLQQLHTSQREFFDDVSHALQTPLTVLKGSVEKLQREDSRPKESLFPIIETCIDDVTRMVRNMLALARVDTNPLETQMTTYNLSSSLQRIVEYVATIAQSEDIKVETNIQEQLHVHADELQIEEVMVNLLSNALKYTSKCTIRSIQVGLTYSPKGIRLSIHDSGVGMTEQQISRIGTRFYRVERDGCDREGNGLGLAIVKRILARHGSLLEITSKPGKGTLVTFVLPNASAEITDSQTPLLPQ